MPTLPSFSLLPRVGSSLGTDSSAVKFADVTRRHTYGETVMNDAKESEILSYRRGGQKCLRLHDFVRQPLTLEQSEGWWMGETTRTNSEMCLR